MQLHDLQPKTRRSLKKRVGRGGKRGKTSGRGHKGQKARAGHKIRPEERDLIKKIPKLRGHGINRARTVSDAAVKAFPVNLRTLEEYFSGGENVTPRVLKERGVIQVRRGMKKVPVKILGSGTLSKKLVISGCSVSKNARAQIEKVGGTIA